MSLGPRTAILLPSIDAGKQTLDLKVIFETHDRADKATYVQDNWDHELEQRKLDLAGIMKDKEALETRIIDDGTGTEELVQEAGRMLHLMAMHRKRIKEIEQTDTINFTYEKKRRICSLRLSDGVLTTVPSFFPEGDTAAPSVSSAQAASAAAPTAGPPAPYAPRQWVWLAGSQDVVANVTIEDTTELVEESIPKSRLTTCVYQSDFDKNGVFYYLATNGGATPWRNPHPDVVKVTGSHPESAEFPFANIFTNDEVPASMKVSDQKNWLMVDLGPTTTLSKITHYSCRAYMGVNLRSWNLEGSLDGKTWKILKSHVKDASLPVEAGVTHTWELPGDSDALRYIRFRLTGPDSHDAYNLVTCGFEVYGTLRTRCYAG